VTELDVQLWPLGPAEMARFLASRRSAQTSPPGQPITTEISLDGRHNLPGTRPVKVRELLAGKGTGLFHLVTTAPEMNSKRSWQQIQRVTGQITDLAVHSKLGATSGIVWVTRVSNGTVVPGAALSLYDADGAVKWQGKTDGDGLARVPGLASLLGPGKGSGRRHRDAGGGPAFALVAASLGGGTGVTPRGRSGGVGPSGFRADGGSRCGCVTA